MALRRQAGFKSGLDEARRRTDSRKYGLLRSFAPRVAHAAERVLHRLVDRPADRDRGRVVERARPDTAHEGGPALLRPDAPCRLYGVCVQQLRRGGRYAGARRSGEVAHGRIAQAD
eukprot:CAMPEP_0179944926 /NCGR_PEP_ID=MMETSP0983-20121128/19351_1 /TAXON_ID=483367 /ORGANISM="non described non described, Strain CCMP 2436" /LENGTH=115 /DNA_ID=CAMNT_0021853209 /DNA_START=93 /DNA_END=437 /DNA_ORIENTATION=-